MGLLNQLMVPAFHYTRALLKTNIKTKTYGLALTEADAARIVASTDETLKALGRIELSSDLIPKIIISFAASSYIDQDDYAQTVCQLLECFYGLRNEGFDELSDDELIEIMRTAFDYQCHGVAELLLEEARLALNRTTDRLGRGSDAITGSQRID
ncbi:MAG: DUF6323 family protein [Methylocystaceae bacterium]